MRPRLLVVTAFLTVTLTACGTTAGPATPQGGASAIGAAVPIGQKADLNFTATALDGRPFDGRTLAGKPTVLWFWAPWCTTCLEESPNVSALGRQYSGRVNVVGIASLAPIEMINDIAPKIHDITHLVDLKAAVWDHFGVQAQSTYLVIDRQGRVVASGYLADADLNKLVAQIANPA